jgi:hypothetical protein
MKTQFNIRDSRQVDSRVVETVGQRKELLKQRDQENLQFLKRIFGMHALLGMRGLTGRSRGAEGVVCRVLCH